MNDSHYDQVDRSPELFERDVAELADGTTGKPAPTKFKKGDEVRLTKDCGSRGAVGEVLTIAGPNTLSMASKGYPWLANDGRRGFSCGYAEDEIELVNLFKVGDFVSMGDRDGVIIGIYEDGCCRAHVVDWGDKTNSSHLFKELTPLVSRSRASAKASAKAKVDDIAHAHRLRRRLETMCEPEETDAELLARIKAKKGELRRKYPNDIERTIRLEVDLGPPAGVHEREWLATLLGWAEGPGRMTGAITQKAEAARLGHKDVAIRRWAVDRYGRAR